MTTAQLVAGLLLQALQTAGQYAALQAKAAQEGRELTIDDLKTLQLDDDAARAALEAAIARHEAAAGA